METACEPVILQLAIFFMEKANNGVFSATKCNQPKQNPKKQVFVFSFQWKVLLSYCLFF